MRREIKQLLLLNSVFVLAAGLFAPLYALYVQHIDASILHVGAIWSVFIFSMGAFSLLLSKYSKTKTSGLFLILGFIFRAIGWLGYFFATSVWQLYFIQLFLAAGEAFGTPGYNRLFSALLDKNKHGYEWNIGTSAFAFATGIASFVGVLIVDRFGFKTLFLVMILLSIVSTALALKYKNIFTKANV